MAEARYSLDVQMEGMEAITRALKAEEDGKQLAKEFRKEMREVLKPAAAKAKSGIMSMGSSGSASAGPALRASIAKRIRPEVRTSGRFPGARVKARKTPNIRGFRNAPKRTQSTKGWRRPVFGNRNAWVTQVGKREWFHSAMRGAADPARRAAQRVMESMAERIARRR